MSRAWSLPFTVPPDVAGRAGKVRAVLFDVDGVLTDGKLRIGTNGEQYKSFDVQDGHGFHLLADVGITTGIITARESDAVRYRATELGIPFCFTGRKDKLAAFAELLQRADLRAEDCCYVGDDVVDIPVLVRCGLAIAVANANHVVRRVAHWTTPAAGGRGAARQVCEMVLWAQNKFDPIIESYLKLEA